MEAAVIVGDVQAPFHDPQAWEVMLQVAEDVKPNIFILNGDLIEFRSISMRWPAKDLKEFTSKVGEEVTTAKGLLREAKKRIGAKVNKFNEGNHEWRLFRAMAQNPQTLKMLGIPEVAKALAIDSVLGLDTDGWQYSGEYPAGTWLWNRQPENNVLVHHSYITRKKSGYTAHSEIDTRLCSTITGHGEKLAVVWRRGMEKRVFAAEGGNLSRLGEAKKGQGIYTSIPFNQPEFMDRQQGFIVAYLDGNQTFPFAVPIHHGKAVFNGRVYKA